MIDIEFMQLNTACNSEDTEIKVYKSDGSPAKFKPTALTQWCFLDGKTSILCTSKRDSHLFHNKEFVLSCVSLRPSLKSTLTRGLFYIPPPQLVIFAPTILQFPWFTGDPTQRGS